MSRRFAAAVATAPIRDLRTLARWVRVTLVAVVLACAAILLADVWGAHRQEAARQALRESLQARTDLERGMLHLSLASPAEGAWRRDAGLALLSQALRTLQQTPDPALDATPPAVQEEARDFAALLLRWRAGVRSDADLNQSLHRLTQALDAQITRQRLHDEQQRLAQQRLTRIVVVAAGLSLLALGLVLLRGTLDRLADQGRVEAAEAAEAAGEGHRNELESRVAERTETLADTLTTLRDDVDSLRRTEQHLQQANEALVVARDRAEAGSRAKSAFLANMSHEIRTPMNAVIGLTHLLARDLAGSHYEARLNKVGAAASHLLAIVNNVLDLAKIESGRLELRPRDFELAELLERTLDLVRERAHTKGLKLEVETGDVPARLHGDATLLQQALVNLVGNAVKFTEIGWVRLSVESLASTAPGLLRFAVTDTGPGVPAPLQGQLFEAFMQADNSSTRRHGGTGLGLAITRRIAEQMGGSAGLDSTPGTGSTFWITVRLRPALQAAGDAAATEPVRQQDVLRTDRARH